MTYRDKGNRMTTRRITTEDCACLPEHLDLGVWSYDCPYHDLAAQDRRKRLGMTVQCEMLTEQEITGYEGRYYAVGGLALLNCPEERVDESVRLILAQGRLLTAPVRARMAASLITGYVTHTQVA